MQGAMTQMPSQGTRQTPEEYNAGLGNLRIYIESRLEETGAKLGSGSIMHPRWPVNGEPPDQLRIYVVPYNAPGTDVIFARDEICDCKKGVLRGDVKAKVTALVDKFLQYREHATYAMLGGTRAKKP